MACVDPESQRLHDLRDNREKLGTGCWRSPRVEGERRRGTPTDSMGFVWCPTIDRQDHHSAQLRGALGPPPGSAEYVQRPCSPDAFHDDTPGHSSGNFRRETPRCSFHEGRGSKEELLRCHGEPCLEGAGRTKATLPKHGAGRERE